MSEKRINSDIITYFKITGDFEPEIITKALKLTPTETWRKGDVKKGKNALEYKFSLWGFGRIKRENNLFGDEQMIETLTPLLGKVQELKALKKEYDLTYFLEVVPRFYSVCDKPIISPPKEVIEFCYLTETQIDVDYYFYFDDIKDE